MNLAERRSKAATAPGNAASKSQDSRPFYNDRIRKPLCSLLFPLPELLARCRVIADIRNLLPAKAPLSFCCIVHQLSPAILAGPAAMHPLGIRLEVIPHQCGNEFRLRLGVLVVRE